MISDLEETMAWQMRSAGLPTPEREQRLVAGRRFRFDFSWPAQMVALEVDGGEWIQGRHQRPGGFRSDAEKFSLAAAAGWRVMRATGSMVRDGSALALVEAALKSGDDQ